MVPKVAFRTHFKPDMYPKRVNHEHDKNFTDYSISKTGYKRERPATAHLREFKGDWL